LVDAIPERVIVALFEQQHASVGNMEELAAVGFVQQSGEIGVGQFWYIAEVLRFSGDMIILSGLREEGDGKTV